MGMFRLRGGTSLSDREFREIVKESSEPRARYSMTAGQAYSRFFEGLKNGVILGTVCDSCGMVFIPPKIYCPYCFRSVSRWVESSGEGKVFTAVASYISADVKPLDKPEIVAVIKLDVPGYRFDNYRFPGIMHRICNASDEDVKTQRIFDARVRARWLPKEKRTGSINDIECFEVVWG